MSFLAVVSWRFRGLRALMACKAPSHVMILVLLSRQRICLQSPFGLPPFSIKHPQDNLGLQNAKWHPPNVNWHPRKCKLVTSNLQSLYRITQNSPVPNIQFGGCQLQFASWRLNTPQLFFGGGVFAPQISGVGVRKYCKKSVFLTIHPRNFGGQISPRKLGGMVLGVLSRKGVTPERGYWGTLGFSHPGPPLFKDIIILRSRLRLGGHSG